MKNNNTPSVVSNSPTPATIVPSGFTLGLDLGDRSHHVCVMDATGQIVREGALSNTRPALAKLLAEYPRATVALEAGTHSPWISRYLTGLGAKVIVGNRCLSDARRRPTGIGTRCKRCNAAEGDVARPGGIVVCLINTGDLAIFGLFGRFVAKTAVSCWNGRLFRLDVPAV